MSIAARETWILLLLELLLQDKFGIITMIMTIQLIRVQCILFGLNIIWQDIMEAFTNGNKVILVWITFKT
ncbi:hypothetical protein A8B98_22745 [Hymenobacter sp. UV11]|nr:hypothetical protein A8B98_22745 [Hymenobacter sp. UV11]